MEAHGTNLYMTRGDSASITVNMDGVTLSSGDKIEMMVRKSAKSAALIHKVVATFSDNSAAILIAPSDTSGLDFGDYLYDIQYTSSDGDVYTIIKPSKFTIGEEITYGE